MINKFLSGVAESIGNQIVDAYWNIATSGLVLAILLGVALALRLYAVVPLIPIQYRAFAKPVATLCLFFFVLNLGYRIADRRNDLVQARVDNAFLQFQLDNEQATARDKTALAERSRAEVSAISEKVKKYEDELAKNPPLPEICDDRGSVDEQRWLHEISRGNRRAKQGGGSIIERLRGIVP